ncbi:diaminopimelate epimerase [Nocardioides flavus (ex Wang et al. 2016)]|uniref:Diaminopimelate epimerase n=1 Tax=Nocardioides flavus (ex Wang et al. 2016) TaxID=2058780 RepID=A0ABQ3HNI3_9ACTN|nr:diaminopimelate epimerase [Nocardioides flavus (ex Wang et al. 2016)]GHE19227.1 diaminopimelate epimerase [Nocardioides flavus (ex Wang et al. 2016)]
MSYRFLKGHGTENDFVVLPDPDGTVHGGADGEMSAERVRALCDRRAGIGGDGVLRAVRRGDGWFMDYRNADGSVSEMCGNGIRVFARYLHEHEGEPFPMRIQTRDGVKVLDRAGDELTADMGRPQVLGETSVSVMGRSWPAVHVSMGNPHAVAFVDNLAEAGPLLEPPEHDDAVYPEGVNVEFVVRRGEHHVAMRVHERGSGETRSCGTGACAVAVATALADGAPRGTVYRVDLPGGTLRVEWTEDDRVLMTGPAVLVAEGTTDL